MGGPGSGRWNNYRRRTIVEECNVLSIYEVLRGPPYGGISWKRAESPAGSIRYMLRNQHDYPVSVDLLYSLDEEILQYTVTITQTVTSWGSMRYWFVCPNKRCNRRVAKLYRTPEGKYFLCRHCYRLGYSSALESHKYDRINLTDDGTGLSYLVNLLKGNTLRAAIESVRTGNISILPKKLRIALRAYSYQSEIRQKRIDRITQYEKLREEKRAARYADYLSASDLCEHSNLTKEELELLQLARLLIPDFEDRYRPKLLGWARKLAYLFHEGWTVEEIKKWASGRWSTSNPRLWPPNKKEWQIDLVSRS